MVEAAQTDAEKLRCLDQVLVLAAVILLLVRPF